MIGLLATRLALVCLAASASAGAGTSEPVPYVLDVAFALRETLTGRIPVTALAVDSDTGLWSATSLYRPGPRTGYLAGILLLDGEVELGPRTHLRALLDTGELRGGNSFDPPVDAALVANGQALRTAFGNGSMIRELDLVLSPPHLSVDVGKRRYNLGQSLVFDDFAWGVAAEARDDGALYSAQLALLLLPQTAQLPTPRSPLAFLVLRYNPSYFDSVEVFAAYFRDVADSLGAVVDSVVAERIIVNNTAAAAQTRLTKLFTTAHNADASVWFGGATASLTPLAGLRLRTAAVLQRGGLAMSEPGHDTLDLQLTGWAAQASAAYELHAAVTVSGFAFALSGDAPPRAAAVAPTYHGFIGVAPYLTWSGLFFAGGLDQGFFSGRATAAGVNGHGVAGLGASCEVGSLEAQLEGRALYLAALTAAPGAPLAARGSVYGSEYDVVGRWVVAAHLSLGVEADLFVPGSFFPSADTAWRVLGQVHVTGGN